MLMLKRQTGIVSGSSAPERLGTGPGRCLRVHYESHSEPVSFPAPYSSPVRGTAASPQAGKRSLHAW